jgi:diacylglycerol kinase (ATP)
MYLSLVIAAFRRQHVYLSFISNRKDTNFCLLYCKNTFFFAILIDRIGKNLISEKYVLILPTKTDINYWMKKSVAVIVNPISGTKNKESIKRVIYETLDTDLLDVRVVSTLYAGHGAEIATMEREKHTDIVVAVGGDGTVNEVARALAGSDTALAIVPCGSGNGLARHLHIPMDVRKAVKVINSQIIETIDYGAINDHPFFCTCGVGFDASVTMDFSKKGSRGLLTYVETTMLDYLRYKPEIYTLTTDEEGEKQFKAFLVTVANASQYGNNAYIAPRATMRDGLLDVMVLAPFKTYDVPILAYRLFNKKMEGSQYITRLLTKHLTIHREQAGCAHYDGEPLETGADIDIRIFPGQLKVVVPSEIQEI